MTKFVKNGCKATSDFEELKHTDCILMCVPTPLDIYEQPDMSYVKSATKLFPKISEKANL